MKRKIVIGFLTGALAISSIIVAPSVETANAQSINDVREKKKQTQKELSNVREQKKKAKNEVSQIDSQMTETTNKIVKKEDEVVKNRKEIERLEEEIKEAEIRIAERDAVLKERVRSMHVNGGAVNYLEVLLGSQSFGDFLDRVLALNVIAEQDRTIIEEQKADKLAIEENKAEVEKLVKQIEEELANLEKLKDDLITQMAEKEKLLEEIAEEEEVLDAEFKGYVAEEKALEQQLRAAQARADAAAKANSSGSSSSGSTGVSYRKSSGMFLWPAAGRFSSGYGWRIHPIYKTRKLHKGIDIANAAGTPIRAAAAGKVTAAGWHSGGYGNYIKIDHGNGYVTLYAHLSSISVRKGQSVSAGQHIGGMGTTGSSTGNHLHFEVHKGGSTVDPLNHL